MKKKEGSMTEEYLINGWLQKYHGITVAELMEKEPELVKTSDWYRKYEVTNEQHDEWYEWAIKELQEYYGGSKKYIKRSFAFGYLNCSPSVKKEKL